MKRSFMTLDALRRPRMLKPQRERALHGRLKIDVGRLQAGQSPKELSRRLLKSRKGLRCPTELMLAYDTDFAPMDGGYPVLRLGGLCLDAGDDCIGSPPHELRVSPLDAKDDLPDCELVGLHDAFFPCSARAGRNARTRAHLCGR